jgi:hypothetical protein
MFIFQRSPLPILLTLGLLLLFALLSAAQGG